MHTKREWKAGFNPGVTGPTTPFIEPFAGGRNWPYRTINVGTETIAIVPAQAKDRRVGKRSEPLLGSAEANSDLIVAAVNACQATNPDNPMAVAQALPKMVEALKLWDSHQQGTRGHYCAECTNALQDALAALAAIEEK